MSVRIDASGDYLRRTANLPAANAFTQCAWFYYVATRSAYAFFLGCEDATTNATKWNLLGFRDTNAFEITVTSGDTTFASNPATGAWHFVALTGTGTTLTGYHWTAAGVLQTATATLDASFTPAAFWFGSDSYNEWVNCRLSHMRLWDVALTQTQLQQEMWRSRPVNLASLNGNWNGYPGATERLRDYGPNARNLTAGGTLTDEAGPPLPVMWDAPLGFPWKVAAAPGGDPEGSLLGGKLLRGGLLTHGVLVRG